MAVLLIREADEMHPAISRKSVYPKMVYVNFSRYGA